MFIKNRKNFLLIILASLIFIGLLIGAFFIYKNKIWLKKTVENQTNLSGKLFGPISDTRAENLDPDKIIYWTNKYRKENDIPALTKNNQLTSAATTKVDDMFKNQYFEHISPSGVKPSDLVTQAEYKYKTTGENLALGDFKDEKDLVDAWMASPGHRANILNVGYSEIGVASKLGNFEDRKSTWMSVQEFGKPLPNCDNPDKNIQDDVNSKTAEYDNLVSQINTLNSEATSLNEQANLKIQQGNDIYASTHDQAQAQPYWTEGENLRSQAETKTAQAKTLSTSADNLQTQIQQKTDEYNTQVNKYNSCINN